MKSLNLAIALLAFIAIGCAISSRTSPKEHISLATFDEIEVGKLRRPDAQIKLGIPDKIVQLKDHSDEEYWLYFRWPKPLTRISLIFDTKTGTLKRKNWFIGPNEAENNLATIKSRYPRAKWKSRRIAEGTHFISYTTVHYDDALGLSIPVAEPTNEPEAISWVLPESTSLIKANR